MTLKEIDPAEFVDAVQPVLETQDPAALLALLKSRWDCGQITALLSSDNCDARKVAALSLALVGTRHCIPKLEAQLKHPDPMVNQMAEHALWAVWFRCGTPEANRELCRGTKALNHKAYEQATGHFSQAIELDPTFAEAYNQRAIVKYLQDRYHESLEDCVRTVDRMPCHFGAWAGMGHCNAHQGQLSAALDCYQRAIRINPRLSGLQQVIGELKSRLE